MVDLSHKKIEDLFYSQIRKMTLKNRDSLSVQFGDSWF
jgi:hypothetical protein